MSEHFAEYGAAYEKLLNPDVATEERPTEEVATEDAPVQEAQTAEETVTEQVAEPEGVSEQPKPDQLYTIKVRGKEKKVNEDDLIRLAQMGDDYSYHMSQLKARAEEFDVLTPLTEQFKSSPEFRNYVANFGKQNQQQPAQVDDPVEQFKREIVQEALREIQPKVEAPIAQLAQQNQQAMILARIQADDPTGEVQKEMRAYVDAFDGHLEYVNLPNGQRVVDPRRSYGPKFREYMALDNDPREFMSTYMRCKESVLSRKSQAQTPPATANPQSRTVSSKAPVLEGGGVEAQGLGAKQSKELRKTIRNRALSGDLTAAGQYYDLLFSK
jgi:hypothetical protein